MLIDLTKIDMTTLEGYLCNERPIEIQALEKLVSIYSKDISNLLDVGASFSHNYYAKSLRKLLNQKRYDCVDIIPDPKVKEICDNYYVGNVCDVTLGKYDCVSCISVIEHCRLTTYKKADYEQEQLNVFQKMISISNKHLLITCPFGLRNENPREVANITSAQLDKFNELADDHTMVNTEFYFSEFPQGREPYKQITLEEASTIPLLREFGVRCVAVLHWQLKEQV